jgi:hypothetical protein
MSIDISPELTPELVAARKHAPAGSRVVFGLKGVYGLSPRSIEMPINERESIESGQIAISMDPDTDHSFNIGIIDFEQLKLKVRYGVQIVFPGLWKLVTEGNYDPGLLNPVRAMATDTCTVTEDLRGWHALGTLQFLPGSIWAGAEGG